MALKKRYYGIKFPFTSNNNEELFIDLNKNRNEKISSQIAHILLTPKGSRIRMPEFGTDLIKSIFSPNDEVSWDDVKEEIIKSVKMYLPEVLITDINIIKDENNDNVIYIGVNYSVTIGDFIEDNKMYIKI